MKVRIEAIGKFDKVGDVVVADEIVTLPGEVPIRWTIPIRFLFIRTQVTIVGRIKATHVPE